MTDFLTAAGWCLFGVAAVLIAVFALKMLKRLDRVLTLVESRAMKSLSKGLVRIIGKP